MLDSRPRGHGFEPCRRHCVVSLSKTHLSLFSTGSIQEDPSRHNWKIVDLDEKNQTNKIVVSVIFLWNTVQYDDDYLISQNTENCLFGRFVTSIYFERLLNEQKWQFALYTFRSQILRSESPNQRRKNMTLTLVSFGVTRMISFSPYPGHKWFWHSSSKSWA